MFYIDDETFNICFECVHLNSNSVGPVHILACNGYCNSSMHTNNCNAVPSLQL
jgi:hypothetical protein